ncbi:MAG TPA: DUF3592 domain-containing protein [Planctomycetota bacterium]|nr:DUF3592 domain-containing protein [Planctomycetota bacterium]OQC19934.1 MAG: hypothetical protein BWX69_02324 [Planctomycetes bacterium ADurb.Bin069]HNR99842.1 DUF3592 domain-containing protein [Planctomycetota bacterium]HNU26315.1 DUF3592 domain-containing protein [Planctomycetota bacterium]HOE28862.1 DUF3592 domain-containing protein [Planctomycetota bacterium]
MITERPSRRASALSESPPKARGFGCIVLFGAVFFVVGCVILTIFVAMPLWQVWAARDWVEVPCTILESRVAAGRDRDTYRVEVRYEYRYAAGPVADAPGLRYESDRYDFSNGVYTSGRKGKEAIVAALPAGAKTVCRVNPRRPEEAVLEAGVPAALWFGFLLLLFPLAGAAAMAFGIRGIRRERARRAGRLPQSAHARPAAPGVDLGGDMQSPCVLEPGAARRGKALGLGIFAVLWNGILWTIFITAVLPDAGGGLLPSFGTALIAIFLLVGLFLAGAALHAVLALANPRIRLTLSRRAVRPGERIEVRWECDGNAARIDTLALEVEGREEATYSRGTSTSTDTRVFARFPLATVEGRRDIETGRAAFALPADAAPTFEAPHNKLRWRLTVRGVIRHWPDINDAYDLLVSAGREGSR